MPPGSSPLTRGKLGPLPAWVSSRRLIPAHAGKTIRGGDQRSQRAAHPRSRGENRVRRSHPSCSAGSSPLTRGKPRSHWRRAVRGRLIPAHAGKTRRRRARRRLGGAHPRSRGENAKNIKTVEIDGGSSPLTRGKPTGLMSSVPSQGLIPAHAGKTPPVIIQARDARAHPRSRGENLAATPFYVAHRGSSPLTRGKPRNRKAYNNVTGLIPAHAGKTAIQSAYKHSCAAHPRSRGENCRASWSTSSLRGSSPLTRGKPASLEEATGLHGLIPAHAGKTWSPTAKSPLRTAHPRSRGENRVAVYSITTTGGSSPLTRGKHFPTCAFTAQIDQILETLELAVSSGSYSVWVACATDAPQDQVRSIGLVLPSSRGAS